MGHIPFNSYCKQFADLSKCLAELITLLTFQSECAELMSTDEQTSLITEI